MQEFASTTAAVIGCLISCASEAASSPIMLTRFMWARSRLELAQSLALFLGALALGNIRYGPDEDQSFRIFADQTMCCDLNVLDSTVSHQQAMLVDEIAAVPLGAVDAFPATLRSSGWTRSMTNWEKGLVPGS